MSDLQSQAPRSTPRVVVVGCGHWGKNLARDFCKLGALEAVVEANRDTAREICERLGTKAVDLDGALNDPAVDGVVVALPAAAHAEIAEKALRAGKHVYVEKPLALNRSDGERLVKLARSRGSKLMVGHLLQYHPAFMELRRQVRDGRLGKLHYIYSNRLSFGIIRREEDALWSLGPHDFSMILSLADEEPEDVTAQGTYALHAGISDVAQVQLGFASGLRAHVLCSWLHPFKEQRLVVIGERGALVFEDSHPVREDKLRFFANTVQWKDGAPRAAKGDIEQVPFPDANPLVEECRHFLDAIANDTEPRTNGDEGLRVLSVLDRAAHNMAAARAAHVPAREPERFPGATVHESAYVDDGVSIGEGTRIWHFSHIIGGTTIGSNVSIGQNVVAGPNVAIGDGVKVQNNVSLYEGVTLEDGVFCGPSCVFTNVVNPRAEIVRKSEIRRTNVGRGATIGANATIVCGHDIGRYAFIAAGAVVAKDVPAFALMAGVPARRIGWMSRAGMRLDESLVCPLTGVGYRQLDENTLEEIAE